MVCLFYSAESQSSSSSTREITPALIHHEYCKQTSVESTGSELSDCSVLPTLPPSVTSTSSCIDMPRPSDCGMLPSVSPHRSQCRGSAADTPRKQRLRQIVNKLRVQAHRARKTKAILEAKVKHTRVQMHRAKNSDAFVAAKGNNAKINKIVEQAREFLPDLTLNFFRSQLKAFCNNRKQNMRWSQQDKLVALSIYYHGSKQYRFLSRLFQLPSVSSLRRWMHNINVYPGISKQILQILKKKFAHMSEISKLCSLSFDEMSIKTGLRYDCVNDCFVGLEDYGDGCRGKGLANQALVVMIRGLTSNWKQALGYCFAAGGTKSVMLQHIVTESIELVKEAGGHVKVIVCDQGSNNRALFSQLGITVEHPYFEHESGKIFAMFDPPHLFKSVRNNLLKYVFQIGEDGHCVDWHHIRQFYDFDSKQPLRLCPKLTIRHMDMTSFSKMKVSYAVQVLSKSVAAGINTYVSLKALPADASDTAKFLETMDNLIDCFNSRSQYASKTKPHKNALSPTSVHLTFLHNALEWINTWKVIGARSSPPCIHGLKLSISAIIHLWTNLNTHHGFKFLMTSRLNQDCLENFFSVIRQAGGCRDNPNAEQFGQAFRQCAVKSLLVVPKTANCAADKDILLADIMDLSCKKTEQTPSIPTVLDMTCDSEPQTTTHKQLCIVPEDMLQAQSDVADDNIISYISGYLIKKIFENHNCSDDNCSSYNLQSNSGMFELQSQTFMYHKALLREIGDFGGLKCPSKQLVTFVKEMECVFRKEINHIYHCTGVCRRLGYKMDTEVGTQLSVCPVAVKHMKHLFLVMRLHAASKFFSRDTPLQASGRKNRKASKVMHL